MIAILGFFAVLFSIALGAIFLVTRRTPAQRSVSLRVARLVAPSSRLHSDGEELEGYSGPVQAGASLWIEQATAKTASGRWLSLLIARSGKKVSPRAIVSTMSVLGTLTGTLTYWRTERIAVALPVALLAGGLPVFWLIRSQRKRLALFNEALPDCLEMCARALRAGHSLTGALDMVAKEAVEPAKTEFADLFRKQSFGMPVRDAFLEMLKRVPSADLRVFVTGVLVQRETGGNLADVLDRIVSVTRERIRIKGDIRVHTAQGRLTGWILSLLPAALLLGINVINPGYSHAMFATALGRKLLLAGLLMLMMGVFTVRHIVNRIEV